MLFKKITVSRSRFTCALLNLEAVVETILVAVMFEFNDSFELARDSRDIRVFGDNDTLAMGTKMPCFSGHSKYLTLSTDPSFFPVASSSSTPHQVPVANLVSPIYCKMPVLLPNVEDTITRSPIASVLASVRCRTID